jgi:hypothetical protein
VAEEGAGGITEENDADLADLSCTTDKQYNITAIADSQGIM